MKRQIIRIIVCIAAVTMLLAGIFAMNACGNKTGDDGATYQLNLSNYDGIVTYGEPMDLSRITITRTADGVSSEIPVDASMVITHVDTTKIGAKLLKLNYAGQTFTVPVIVKYKINFEVDGEVLKTFHVLNAAELEEVVAPDKPGYSFSGWSGGIPEVITDNMTLRAVYTLEIPEISEVEATYGDALSSIKLPYTVVGAWEFESTAGTVGDAGKRTFPVRFVAYENNEVLATDTVTVNVAKKQVVFSDVVDSFTYNGTMQLPTYKTDVPVKVMFYQDSEANYTDAGKYDYYFEVDDPNYEGTLVGSYEIKPAYVTVKINSYTILSNEELPVVGYQVSGFDDLDLLGLSVTNPEDVVTGVGTYTLTATTSNKNIVLTVEEGTLTIHSTSLEIADPTLSTGVLTYGDMIGEITFNSHPNGKWTWKNPTDLVGTVGKQTHIAVFTPTDSRYEVIERAVEITVAPKALIIEIVGSTVFDYNSAEERTLSYIVKDEDGNDYNHLVVLGNTPCKNAGSYEITLTLEDKNYSATKVATLTINKIDPVADFSQVLSATWSRTLKLSNISLPVGYAWTDALSTEISSAGTHRFKAIYTPEDTVNYNTVVGEFEINVEKATASINNVNASYNFTYNGGAFVLDTVTRSHTESELVFSYQLNGKAVASITNAGVYTVTITLPETGNYKAAEATTTVTVAKATNVENIILSQTATYGDLIGEKIVLPAGIEGTWSIQGVDAATKVGDAGTKTFVAVYTSTTGNYNSREVEITVTVAKKRVNAPAISAAYREQVFTGATLTSGLTDAEGYVVTDNGAINVGTHTATVALVSDNYLWSDGTSAEKTLTYRIVAANNQWTVAPGIDSWVYGEAGNAGSAEAFAGVVTIEYKLANADDSTYSTTIPTNAGAYVARFTATDSNYKDLVATCEFTIEKKAIDVPAISEANKEQVYSGSILTSGLTGTSEYTVTDNGGASVGTYTATLVLTDKNNYKWATTGASDNVALTYQVVKAQIVISDFAITGWTYGNQANAPTATTNFGTVSFVYASAIDGEYTATVPTNAGTYYVKAIAQGNENLIGATSEAITFTIAKASVSINGANDTYSKVYDTKEYNVTGVSASNGGALTVVITKNGETVEKMIDAGTYTVTFSIAESANYLAAEKSVTVTITAATNNEVVNTNQSATYGDLISVITLPAGVQGTWSIQGATTVGNAGTNTFTAVFTPANGNYNSREVEITVTVAKAIVKVPIVDPKEYDKQHHNSGLTDTDDYTVTTDNGGIDHGTYEVVLTLTDSANYKWETSDAASITIKYEISAAINMWAEEPSINPSWEYESAGDTGHATALHGGVKIEYKLETEDESAYSTTLPTLPGKYVARFTTTDENYAILKVTKAFEITKRKITPPTQTETEFIYTGNTITSGITGNDFFSVVDNGAINVQAGLVVTVTLNSEYYVWSDGVETLAREYTYSITKAQIVISDLAIENWVYNQSAKVPTATTNFGTVSFVYASAIDGEYTATVPTNAGTYYVKAIAQGNENLIGAESAPVAFTIAKAEASIEGAQQSYTAIYNGNDYVIEGIRASYADAPALEYAKVQNAGTHEIVITLPESLNYLGATVTVTVIITPADNTIDEVDQAQEATYGDSVSVIQLPTSTIGTWSIKGDATTVGNAGKNTFIAVFTPATGNYNGCEVEIVVDVAKKAINVPTISASKLEQTYTGETLTSGLTNAEGYTVADEGGINVGTYTVTITLDANYVWSDGTGDTKTYTYAIVAATNYWDVQPSITESWVYGQTGDAGSATAEFGGVKIEYKLTSAGDDAYSITLPTEAGEYTARFTTTDTNYTKLVETRTFTIQQATVDVPTVDDQTYTGSTITSGLEDTDYYTVTTDEGGINVGTYKVTLTLKDSVNYKWSNSDAETIEVSYSIVQAQAVITGPTIEGWTFGESANDPVASTTFGTVTYLYAPVGGEYSKTVPTTAGDYYVKAVVTGNDNYLGAESAPVAFTIAKAAASIEGEQESYTTTYNGQPYTISGVTASNGLKLTYSYTKDGETVSEMKNAGTYKVVITLAESTNHLGDEVEVTVTINKAVNTDTIPTYTATYGDLLSSLTPPESATGTWSWEDASAVVGNAGVQTHVLVFTPNDTINYETTKANATVTVSKKVVSTPTNFTASMVYNATTQYSGLTNTALYTVTDNGGKDVGTYTVTLTLVDNANYAWNSVDNASNTVTVSYEITPTDNEISATVNDVPYGAELDMTVTVKFGGWDVEFKNAAGELVDKPVAAGSYTAIFTTTDTNCEILTIERVFNINIAKVEPPSVSDKPYTGEKITSGLTSNLLYTVVTDEGGINVGEYTVTIRLTDPNSSEWYEGGSADKVLTYNITEIANTKLEGLTAGWTYGAYVAPTVTVSPAALADKVIFWYSVDGGASWSETEPTNAGTYLIKAEIVGTDNYTGATTDPVEFIIKKATPTITTDPSFVGGTFYQNTFAPTGEGAVTSVAGSWSFEKATLVGGTFSATADNAQVVATFTPNDTDNYENVTVTYSVTFVPVAYLNNETPYGTIEDAITAANNAVQSGATSAEVWVRPSVNLGDLYITSDVTIYSGVTLILPYYYNNAWTKNTITDGTIDIFFSSTGQYEQPAGLDECSLQVVLAAGKKIINNGIIMISGQISGGSGASQYAGFTAGLHARLVLGNNATLENNGTIYAAGFIREETKGNGSTVVLNENSVLYQPYTVKDFPGGSVTYAFYNTKGTKDTDTPITPFSRFILMNVSPMVHINYGGAVRTWAVLWAGSQNNQTVGDIIGSEMVYEKAVIVLTDKNHSYLTAKYDIDTEICDLKIYGGARTNAMILKVNALKMDIEVSTGEYLFAVSYHYNITLAPATGQTDTAVFNMNQRFKIMTGATLTVEKGAKLVATDLIVYEVFEDIRADAPTSEHPMRYPNKPAAVFTVNGEFEVNRFGGKIHTNNVGAKVTIKSATTYSAYEGGTFKDVDLMVATAKAVDQYKTITLNASLVGTTGAITPTTGVTWTVGELTLNPNNGSDSYTILYFYDPANPQYPTLPTPTMEGGYTFDSWVYNGTSVKKGDAMSTTENHTLEAQWVSGASIGLDADGDGVADEVVSLKFSPEDTKAYPAELVNKAPAKDKEGYTFDAWYFGDTEVTANMGFLAEGDHVLTARWTINSYDITKGSCTNAEIVTCPTSATYGEQVTVTVKYTETLSQSINVKDANGNIVASIQTATTLTFTMPASNVTVTASSEKDTCITAGTLITLADGTQKKVEDLTLDDVLLVFNHETGEYEAAGIIFIEDDGWKEYNVITLTFSDGTTTKLIYEHAYFDLTLNKYVYITEQNYTDFVGHEFAMQSENGFERVTLTDATLAVEYTGCYSLVTVYHLNYFVDGLFSIPGGITGLFNMFEYGDDLVYDQEKMQADIEEYGLYTYEDFEEYLPYELYAAFPAPYLKVAVGKGMITFEEILGYIDQFLVKNGLM